jgi:hypothetical protein
MRIILLLPLLLLLGRSGTAQTPYQLSLPPAGVAYSTAYELEEQSYYTIPEGSDPNELGKLDILKLEKSIVRKRVENAVLEDGSSVLTITILNPAEAYHDWPQPIGRYEIDSSGIRVYSPAGLLLQNIAPDSAMTALHKMTQELNAANEPNFKYDFPVMDTEKITALENEGKEVQALGNDAYQIKDALQYNVYDPAYKRTYSRYTDPKTGGEEKKWQVYTTTESGIIMPGFERTTTKIIRPSGACMERVLDKKYSNYVIKARGKVKERHRQVMESGKYLGLFPNPAKDQVTVNLDDSVLPGSSLRVLDALGKTMYTQQDMQPESAVLVDLQGRTPGMYFIQVQTKGGLRTLRFIKQ